MRTYHYVGNSKFLPKGEFPARTIVDGVASVKAWMADHQNEVDIEGNIAATFVVDTDRRFWIADRGSEHVACAREGEVLSAGEVFFAAENGISIIDRITNQSTGYCPEPSSWPAVEKSLAQTGLTFPDRFEPEFEFRQCTACDNLAVVKERFFVCLVCSSELPEHYNVQ